MKWGCGDLTMAEPNETKSRLLHFHVCVYCESAFRRKEFEGRSLTSGIFLCLKCGREGPLNVQILEADEPVAKAAEQK
jgi:hypothetical protein